MGAIKKLLIAFVFLFSANAFAADYYVTQTGAGNNDGLTWANAMAYPSFTPARGDGTNVYYFAGGTYAFGGTYAGKLWNTAVDGTKVITIKKASTTECALANAPAGCINQAVFSEDLSTSTKQTTWHVMTSYWVIDGVTGSGNDIDSYGFKLTPMNCATTYGSYLVQTPSSVNNAHPTDIRISHVAAVNCGAAYDINQYAFGQAPDADISNIVYSNNYSSGSSTNMSFTKCTSGCVADGNYLDANWSSSAHHGGQFVWKGSPSLVIKNNYFKNSCVFVLDSHVTACTTNSPTPFSQLTAVTESRLTDTSASWSAGEMNGKTVCKQTTSTGGNVICFVVQDTGSDYLDVLPATAVTDGLAIGNYYAIKTCYTPNTDTLVYNNIVDGHSTSGTCGDQLTGVFANGDSAYVDVTPNMIVYNNTVYNASVGSYGFVYTGRATNPAEKAIVRNNLFYSSEDMGLSSGIAPDTDYSAFIDCTGTLYTETHDQIGTGDPFTDKASGDFRLVYNSLAVNNGTDLGASYNSDRISTTRPRGTAWDIGAYEYNYGQVTTGGSGSMTIGGSGTITLN